MKIYFFLAAFLIFALAAKSQNAPPPTEAEVQSLPDDTAKVAAWIKLSEAALKQNFEQGKTYANNALALAKSLAFERGMINAHVQLGRAESYISNYSEAFTHYEKAYLYFKETGDKPHQASMLNRMGETQRVMDDYEKALNYMQESLRICQELGDTNEMGSGYISIGILYAVSGDRAEAEHYFLQAIDCFESINNQQRKYLTMLNMAGLYNEMEEYEKAVEFSIQARDYFKANGSEFRLGVVYFNLGVSYLNLNELDKSQKTFEQGLAIFERLGDKLRINGTMMRLAEIDLKNGKTDLALQKALTAAENFKQLESLSQLLFSYSQLVNIYEAKQDYKKALEYQRLHQALKDSVSGEETKNRIAELEKKYQSELKDKQLAEANANLEVNELILQKQQNQKFVFMAVAGFVLIILVLLLNQYRVKKRNNDTLREKNEIIQKSLGEKEVLLKEIHHRVKNNLQFISSLLNLQARHVNDAPTLAVLTESKNRVLSMAMVHQKLYQEDNLTGVEMHGYFANLAESLLHSYKIDAQQIDVKINVDQIYLDIDTAMPLGMILNELLTNVFKYAFAENEKGTVNILLQKENEQIIFSVSDSGCGLPETFHAGDSKTFGFKLVHSLAGKLKASVSVESENGTTVKLTLPAAK